MQVKKAAFIIGSLGGRPVRFKKCEYRGGYIPQETFYLLLENSFRITLEDSSGFVVLE